MIVKHNSTVTHRDFSTRPRRNLVDEWKTVIDFIHKYLLGGWSTFDPLARQN